MGASQGESMKILVTGSDGQLGLALQRQNSNHELVCCDRSKLDIANKEEVNRIVTAERPNSIINCAAFTNVDGCESDQEKAMLINGQSVGFLREAAAGVDAKLIQISTDYVFDGSKEAPYLETDEPNPVSIYGQSKLLGEQLAGKDALIVRTSWVMSHDGKNMLKTILNLLEGENDLFFVSDQIGCPTFTDDLASGIFSLIEKDLSGVFHVTNDGAVSWYQFAVEVAELSGANPDRVLPITTSELTPPRPARRPANSVLANQGIIDSGLSPLPHHLVSLERLLKKMNSQ